jgi:hypothetical protein
VTPYLLGRSVDPDGVERLLWESPGFACGRVGCCEHRADAPHGLGPKKRLFAVRLGSRAVSLLVNLNRVPGEPPGEAVGEALAWHRLDADGEHAHCAVVGGPCAGAEDEDLGAAIWRECEGEPACVWARLRQILAASEYFTA